MKKIHDKKLNIFLEELVAVGNVDILFRMLDAYFLNIISKKY